MYGLVAYSLKVIVLLWFPELSDQAQNIPLEGSYANRYTTNAVLEVFH